MSMNQQGFIVDKKQLEPVWPAESEAQQLVVTSLIQTLNIQASW